MSGPRLLIYSRFKQIVSATWPCKPSEAVALFTFVAAAMIASAAHAQSAAIRVPARVGGQDYLIPREYLLFPPDSKSETLLLGLRLPTYGPLLREDEKPGSGATVITVLAHKAIVTDGSSDLPKDPMERAFYAYAHGVVRKGTLPDFEGMAQTNGKYGEAVFFQEDSSRKLSVFIVCSTLLIKGDPIRPRASYFPGCNHFYISKGVILKLHYGRDWLPDWRDIQFGVERTMVSFQIDATAR